MDVKVIGVDIAKRYFQVHGVSVSGTVMIRRKISRDGFLKLLADLPTDRVPRRGVRAR